MSDTRAKRRDLKLARDSKQEEKWRVSNREFHVLDASERAGIFAIEKDTFNKGAADYNKKNRPRTAAPDKTVSIDKTISKQTYPLIVTRRIDASMTSLNARYETDSHFEDFSRKFTQTQSKKYTSLTSRPFFVTFPRSPPVTNAQTDRQKYVLKHVPPAPYAILQRTRIVTDDVS